MRLPFPCSQETLDAFEKERVVSDYAENKERGGKCPKSATALAVEIDQMRLSAYRLGAIETFDVLADALETPSAKSICRLLRKVGFDEPERFVKDDVPFDAAAFNERSKAAERLARKVLDFDLHHLGMTNLAYTAELESLCIEARRVLGE